MEVDAAIDAGAPLCAQILVNRHYSGPRFALYQMVVTHSRLQPSDIRCLRDAHVSEEEIVFLALGSASEVREAAVPLDVGDALSCEEVTVVLEGGASLQFLAYWTYGLRQSPAEVAECLSARGSDEVMRWAQAVVAAGIPPDPD